MTSVIVTRAALIRGTTARQLPPLTRVFRAVTAVGRRPGRRAEGKPPELERSSQEPRWGIEAASSQGITAEFCAIPLAAIANPNSARPPTATEAEIEVPILLGRHNDDPRHRYCSVAIESAAATYES